MERESTRLSELQILLNEEARLSYIGDGKGEERMKLHTLIRLKRLQPAPSCFGHDDCSSLILSACPWRMDCGT
jgi:hypothetical protein